MIRPIALSLAAGVALLTAAISGAGESFPVDHSEPITVRILNGRNGQPLAHLHLVLIGGYDRHDLHDQLFLEEALTDAHGQVRLSNQLANLPWLQVWVNKKPLCQAHPRKASFSVEEIRRDGLSAPNRCGTATVEDAPGIFTVFVKGKRGAPAADSAPSSAPIRKERNPLALLCNHFQIASSSQTPSPGLKPAAEAQAAACSRAQPQNR
jgi:hypothetical protein